MQKDVEVRWEERVQIDERFAAEIRVVVLGVVKLGVMAQLLAVVVEELANSVLTRRRFTHQPQVTDLFDIAGLQVHLDREPILEFIKLVGVNGRPRIILSQCLLGRGHYPDLTPAESFQVLRHAVQIENQIVSGGDVLTDLVDDEDDVLLAALLADDVDHLPHPLVLELKEPVRVRGEGVGCREE